MKDLLKTEPSRRRMLYAALCTLLFLLIGHAFCWFNIGYSGSGVALNPTVLRSAQISSGSWAQPLYWALRGKLSAPMLVGLLSCLYLALTAAVAAQALHIRTRLPLTLLCGVLSLNACVTAINASQLHIADACFLALLLCVGVILLQVTISTLAAYALSMLRPKGSKWVMSFFLGTMMINSQALAWPTYIMFTNFFGMRLIDNLWSLILSFSAWAWAIFILKSFFDGIPKDLLESARIDGASSARILWSIVMPLSKPVFAVVILNTFMACYNQFIYPLILLPDSANWTIMVRIYAIQSSSSATWNQIMVLLGCATLPVILCYMFAQKYIVQGISMSGLKG